jgi:tRNA threonylcarbamoyl adenosine modification protein YeaZ
MGTDCNVPAQPPEVAGRYTPCVHREWILALETSVRGSVALARGPQAPSVRWLSSDRANASELLPAVDGLLRQAGCSPRDVGLLCYARGPGSFTGLRVGATVARMFAATVACRVAAVSTLDALARNALRAAPVPSRVAVLIDARGGQVFGAAYERAGAGNLKAAESPADEMRITHAAARRWPAAWLSELAGASAMPLAVLGPGVQQHHEACLRADVRVLDAELAQPSAAEVLLLGRAAAGAGGFCRPEEILPLYIRPPECEEVYERRRAEARLRREAAQP